MNWSFGKQPEVIISKREDMILQLELADATMRKTGLCNAWFNAVGAATPEVAKDCNGQLFEQLLLNSGYTDPESVNLLREGMNVCCLLSHSVCMSGAVMIGPLPLTGIGNVIDANRNVDSEMAALKSDCGRSNKALLSRLKEDAESAKLMSITQADAKLERMSDPILASEVDLSSLLLHPRFCVVQAKPDGSTKARAVDNFSWSASGGGLFTLLFLALLACEGRRKLGSVNNFTVAKEKLSHDTLDKLCCAMRVFHEKFTELPGLIKVDVDSAFRRIPIRMCDRWACGVAFLFKGQASA